MEVAHALQQRYMLEAAGSRGVWGLDDFHFLPFLWGAGQLSDQQLIEPAQVHLQRGTGLIASIPFA